MKYRVPAAALGVLVTLFTSSLVAFVACDPNTSPVNASPGTKPKDGSAGPPGSETTDPDADSDTSDAGLLDEAGDDGSTINTTSHVIDGVDDFAAGEHLTSSSPSYTGAISWDVSRVYFGMKGNDVGPGASPKRWVLVYLDTGAAGTTTGVDYNDGRPLDSGTGEQPNLPFSASYHVRIKTDLSYANAQRWDSGQSQWVDAPGLLLAPAKQNDFVEFAVNRATLGNPARIKVHVSMINEQQGAEWTYAGVPNTSFTDGVDRDYTKYYDFDLGNTATAPNTYPIKP